MNELESLKNKLEAHVRTFAANHIHGTALTTGDSGKTNEVLSAVEALISNIKAEVESLFAAAKPPTKK